MRFHQKLLCGEGCAGAWGADVVAFGLEEAGFYVVAQIGGEQGVFEVAEGGFVFDGEDDFAAAVEVAGHPVGAACVNFAFAVSVGEPEYAGVFEEAADDGTHADVFAEAGDAWAQGAHAADDEVDLHASL